MSSLENISLLYAESQKDIQDKLRFYLIDTLTEKDIDKIELIVSDINRLFDKYNIKEANNIYRFSQYCIYDFSLKSILNRDRVIKLNNQEINLLECLIKNRATIVSYERLMYIISKHSYSSIETLRTVIKRLRAKIDKSVIKTVSKVGYRLLEKY